MAGTMSFEHKDVDYQLLNELAEGRNVPANLGDEIDMSRQYVHQRLAVLEGAGEVNNIGRGVYEITDKGLEARQ